MYPIQSEFIDTRVNVYFEKYPNNILPGIIVRDDATRPFITIVRLLDGRFVMDHEVEFIIEDNDDD